MLCLSVFVRLPYSWFTIGLYALCVAKIRFFCDIYKFFKSFLTSRFRQLYYSFISIGRKVMFASQEYTYATCKRVFVTCERTYQTSKYKIAWEAFPFGRHTKMFSRKESYNYQNSKIMHVLNMMIQKIKTVKQNI